MLRKPIQSAAQSKVSSKTRPAPVMGLNSADPLTSMKDGYAIRAQNWVARTDGLHVRPGYVVLEDTGSDAINGVHFCGARRFSTTATQIFEGTSSRVTVSGPGGIWRGCVLPNDGGRFLILANGVSGHRVFNGTDWLAPTVTGMDGSKLANPTLHMRHAFFIERGTLNVWHFGRDAIGGPAYPLPLHGLCRKGGEVVALASITPTGGKGRGDQLAIVTSMGELVIYSGTNPMNASTWSLSGVWTISPPVGRDCFTSFGGHLGILTLDGLLPLTEILAKPESSEAVEAISKKVFPTLLPDLQANARAVVLESGFNNWHLIQANGRQWVRSDTGAWTHADYPATCWGEGNDGLYFGTADGRVCVVGGALDDATNSNGGLAINTFAVDAFAELGTRRRKIMKRIRPMYRLPHPYRPRIEALADYREPATDFAALHVSDKAWFWPADPANPDIDEVSYGMMPAQWERPATSRLGVWRGLSGQGVAIAIQKAMKSRSGVIWTGYDIEFETGGMH